MNYRDRPENPAKTFLKRYRVMLARRESLQRAIDEAYDRATSITARPKEISVTGGPAASDRMAEDVARIADSTEQLKAATAQINAALAEILAAIDAVQDETQRAVLTMRYIEGAGWESIAERMHYEISNTYIIHGRGLWAVRRHLGI